MIERLGERPQNLKPVEYAKDAQMNVSVRAAGKRAAKKHAGVDVFIDFPDGNPDTIADRINALNLTGAKLTVISNRGTKVWPNGNPDTFWSDHWTCRFEGGDGFSSRTVAEISRQ